MKYRRRNIGSRFREGHSFKLKRADLDKSTTANDAGQDCDIEMTNGVISHMKPQIVQEDSDEDDKDTGRPIGRRVKVREKPKQVQSNVPAHPQLRLRGNRIATKGRTSLPSLRHVQIVSVDRRLQVCVVFLDDGRKILVLLVEVLTPPCCKHH